MVVERVKSPSINVVCLLDALITDIKTDIEVAKQSLKREAYVAISKDKLFTNH